MNVISILECQFKPDCVDAGTEWLTRALVATHALIGARSRGHPGQATRHGSSPWSAGPHWNTTGSTTRGGRAKEGSLTARNCSPRKLTVGIVLDGA